MTAGPAAAVAPTQATAAAAPTRLALTAVDNGAAARRPVAGVADSVVDLMRAFGRARRRLTTTRPGDVEWAARLLLSVLRNEGPIRAGSLAEYVHSDPSTVSRHVTTLVKAGYVARQADPDDGRACLLVLTSASDDLLAEHDAKRLEYFDEILAHWSDEDLTIFRTLLSRFAADVDRDDIREGHPLHGVSDAARTTGTDNGTTGNDAGDDD